MNSDVPEPERIPASAIRRNLVGFARFIGRIIRVAEHFNLEKAVGPSIDSKLRG